MTTTSTMWLRWLASISMRRTPESSPPARSSWAQRSARVKTSPSCRAACCSAASWTQVSVKTQQISGSPDCPVPAQVSRLKASPSASTFSSGWTSSCREESKIRSRTGGEGADEDEFRKEMKRDDRPAEITCWRAAASRPDDLFSRPQLRSLVSARSRQKW